MPKNIFKNKIVAISGMNGFIGSNLADTLFSLGAKVAGIDRNLLAEPVTLEARLKEIKPDYIFHLAAYGNHHSQQDIDEAIYANIIKTYTLLRATMDIDYKAFINVSTSSVYKPTNFKMSEDMPMLGETIYANTKAAGEFIARSFAYGKDKPIVNVRPFSVYGNGEAHHRLIPTIIRCLLTDEDLTLFPEPVHDWIYIEDFINGLLAVVENIEHFKGESVNIGTGKQVSNQEVFDILSQIAGKRLRIKTKVTDRDYDVKGNGYKWCADTTKLKMFGWHSKISLESGLMKTYEYYKQMYEPKDTLKDAMEQSLRNFNAEIITTLQ